MRAYGALSPIDGIESPPDSVQTLALAAATAQALDWPNSTGGAAAAASSAGAQLVRFSGMSSANTQLVFMVNLVSTHASGPTSGTSVTTGTSAGSTGNSIAVLGSRYLQIPTWSTGWSAIAQTSGYVIAEVWRK